MFMQNKLYADVILPLAVKRTFTYLIPANLVELACPGSRAIVPFGRKKLYTGIILRIYDTKPLLESLKELIDIIDSAPLLTGVQLKFWEWIAEYYMCSPGEVMKAALPAGLCPESETILEPDPSFTDLKLLDDLSSKLLCIIEKRKHVRLKNLPADIDGQNIIKLVNKLILNKAVTAIESVRVKSGKSKEKYIIAARQFTSGEVEKIIESLKKARRQQELFKTYLKIIDYNNAGEIIPVKKENLLKEADAFTSTLTSLINKGILLQVEMEADECKDARPECDPEPLSDAQSAVYRKIKEIATKKNVVLLHGITSSGKTQIYLHLIKDCLENGKQVLYLLPEISLTSRIIERVKKYFGSFTDVYHSFISPKEKIKIWERIIGEETKKRGVVILGLRSSIFLPFRNLGLIIVDEEHEASYKQYDPAPRYNARDCAVMLASLYGAVTVLGSATPSIESYYNALKGKYELTELTQHFDVKRMPEIIIVNTREAYRKKLMISHFSPQLIDAIKEALGRKEQIMLLRNRRGFAPYLECRECGWIPVCNRCAVNLTYHKGVNKIICHYCGNISNVPATCPSCGSTSIETRGFGTEKIEDEIKIIFPQAVVARMDMDTTRRTDSINMILKDFEAGRIDILVGTRMISRWLDFENLTVVGILNVDSLLNYPDFRANERAFQMMVQISEKACRIHKQSKLIIQAADPSHKILRYVIRNDYKAFYESQIEERKAFNYPPFSRLVKITLKHKDKNLLNYFSDNLGDLLRNYFGMHVLGPEFPVISRIQQWHLKVILIKIEKKQSLSQAKELIENAIDSILSLKGASLLRTAIDVDPY
ncbi:MAG TPA: primosomal protein N' [Bacteroidales bacterium]|nr:primosomal protein N' [Bacteroidales bacterium]